MHDGQEDADYRASRAERPGGSARLFRLTTATRPVDAPLNPNYSGVLQLTEG